MNATQTIQTVVLNDHRFAVEERNENMSFNLTMMSKPYGKEKRPNQWLRTVPAQDYLKALSVMLKSATAENQAVTKSASVMLKSDTAENQAVTDLVEVRQGGIPERQGTWANHYLIAIEYARWLEPKFAIEVNMLFHDYMTGRIKATQPFLGIPPIMDGVKPFYNYLEVLKALGLSTISGSVTERKRKFPNQFKKFFGRNFITKEYAELLQKQHEVVQLRLDLFNGTTFLA